MNYIKLRRDIRAGFMTISSVPGVKPLELRNIRPDLMLVDDETLDNWITEIIGTNPAFRKVDVDSEKYKKYNTLRSVFYAIYEPETDLDIEDIIKELNISKDEVLKQLFIAKKIFLYTIIPHFIENRYEYLYGKRKESLEHVLSQIKDLIDPMKENTQKISELINNRGKNENFNKELAEEIKNHDYLSRTFERLSWKLKELE